MTAPGDSHVLAADRRYRWQCGSPGCPCMDATGSCPRCGRRDAVSDELDALCQPCEDRLAAPEVVHLCPPGDEAQMPCCGGWPLERLGERMTLDPALVTCPGSEPREGS